MIEMKHPRQIQLLEPLVWFALITASIIYALMAFNSGDWLWFTSKAVDARPNRIIVWQDGDQFVIQPGHDDFLQLSEAAHESLKDFNNTNLINVGLGEESLSYYEDKGVLVELFYDRPVKFHAPFRTGEPTQLLVPINGRHAGYDYFFRGGQGEWWFGAMRMTDSTPLMNALSELGYHKST